MLLGASLGPIGMFAGFMLGGAAGMLACATIMMLGLAAYGVVQLISFCRNKAKEAINARNHQDICEPTQQERLHAMLVNGEAGAENNRSPGRTISPEASAETTALTSYSDTKTQRVTGPGTYGMLFDTSNPTNGPSNRSGNTNTNFTNTCTY